MSAETRTTVAQTEITAPKLSDLNPANSEEPLISCIKKGELPSNETVNDAIDRARNSLNEVEKDKDVVLDSRGEKILRDSTHILDSLQKVINERNKDDKIQDLVEQSKLATEQVGKQIPHLVRDVKRAVNDTSKEFPHVPMYVKPLIPLASLSFTGPVAALGSIATLSNFVSETGFKFPAGELKGEAKEMYNYGKELFSYAIRSTEFRGFIEEIVDFLYETFEQGSEKFTELEKAAMSDMKEGKLTSLPHTAETIKEMGKDGGEVIKKKVEWTEEKAKEYYDKFSMLLSKMAEKEEYKNMLDLFWTWCDEVVAWAVESKEFLKDKASEKAEVVKDKVVEKVEKIEARAEKNINKLRDSLTDSQAQCPALDRVWNDIRDIVDGFCGAGSFNHLYRRFWLLYSSIVDDQVAKQFLVDLKSFISNGVNNPSTLKDSKTIEDGKSLLKRGREVFNTERYENRVAKIASQGRRMISRIKNDPLTNDLSNSIQQLGHDLFLDEKGRPDIFVIQDSLVQLKNIAFPLIAKNLANITIERMAGNTDSFDYELEHVVLSIPELVPGSFDIRTKNHIKVGINGFNTKVQKNITNVILDIDKLKPSFKDVTFWYKQKNFPHLEDRGIADIDLSGGQGVKIRVIWKIKSVDSTPFAFSLMRVKCVIDHLDIKIKDAKHEILDKMALPFLTNTIKQAIAQGVVDAIVKNVQPLNDSMNDWFATRPVESIKMKLNDRLHDSLENANEFLQHHPIDQTVEKAKELIDSAKGRVIDAADNLKDSAKGVKHRGIEIRDSLVNRGEGLTKSAQNVLEKAEDVLGVKSGSDLKEKALEAKDKVIDIYESLKGKLPEKTWDILEIGKDKFEQFKEILPENSHELIKLGEEKYKDLKGKLPKEYSDKLDQYFSKATEIINKLKDSGMEKLGELKDKVPTKDQIKDSLPKNADELKEKASELKDSAVDTLKNIKENMPTNPTELVDKVKEVATNQVKSLAKEKIVEMVLDKLPESKEEAKEKAVELKDKAVDYYESLKGKLPENTQELLKLTNEKFAEFKDVLPEKAHKLVEMGEDKYKELKGKLPKEYSDMLDDYYKKASDLIKEAKEKAPKSKEEVKEKASDIYESLKGKLPENTQELLKLTNEKFAEFKDIVPEKAHQLMDLGEDKFKELKDKLPKEYSAMLDDYYKKASDLIKEAKEKAPKSKEEAKEKASDIYESLKGKLPEKTQELLKLTNEKFAEYKDIVPEKASELIEMGEDKYKELKGKLPKEYSAMLDDYYKKASDLIKEAKEKAPKSKEEAKEKASDIYESLKGKLPEKTQELLKLADDKYAEFKDVLPEKASELIEMGEDKYKELKGKLPKEYSAMLDDYYKKASDLIKEAKDKAGEVKEKATDKVKEIREELPNNTADLKDLAVDAKDKAMKKGEEIKEKVEEKAEEAKVDLNRTVNQVGISYAYAVKEDLASKKVGKSDSKSKQDWTHQWEKPKKTFKAQTVEKKDIIEETTTATGNENPFDALASK